MAKQTFTVGQVLTAAQLTSLQQTAMGGGAASAKTASYTLVAADAGTTISMTSTSATTITVNTGLFAAGDTVFIQNLGSGNLTITAGSATVATAGSLVLPQNDAGILYFVSTSSSVFYDFIQVGATSPLTTKGDLYTFSTSDARLGVGANGTVLTAASGQATGLEWATPAGGMTLISTTSLTGASTTLSSIPSTFINLQLVFTAVRPATDGAVLQVKMNGTAQGECGADIESTSVQSQAGADLIKLTRDTYNAADTRAWLQIVDYASTTNKGYFGGSTYLNTAGASTKGFFVGGATRTSTSAISSIVIQYSSGNITSGSVKLYGMK